MDAAVREPPVQTNPCGGISGSPGLSAYGGMRVGEALALRRRHVDLLGAKVLVAESLSEISGNFTIGPTKTQQVREVPPPRSLLTFLEQHLDEVPPGRPTGRDPAQPARVLRLLARRGSRRTGGRTRPGARQHQDHDMPLRTTGARSRPHRRRPSGPGPAGRESSRRRSGGGTYVARRPVRGLSGRHPEAGTPPLDLQRCTRRGGSSAG